MEILEEVEGGKRKDDGGTKSVAIGFQQKQNKIIMSTTKPAIHFRFTLLTAEQWYEKEFLCLHLGIAFVCV